MTDDKKPTEEFTVHDAVDVLGFGAFQVMLTLFIGLIYVSIESCNFCIFSSFI